MLLEELGIPYNLHAIDLSKNEQKEAWYLKINPNGRIPSLSKRLSFTPLYSVRFSMQACCSRHFDQLHNDFLPLCQLLVVDHEAGDLPVFESGSILWYLATKYGKFFPKVRASLGCVLTPPLMTCQWLACIVSKGSYFWAIRI